MHYCPGCTHWYCHRLVAEAMDELDIEGITIGIASVGCSYNSYDYFGCDMIQCPHGRASCCRDGLSEAPIRLFIPIRAMAIWQL